MRPSSYMFLIALVLIGFGCISLVNHESGMPSGLAESNRIHFNLTLFWGVGGALAVLGGFFRLAEGPKWKRPTPPLPEDKPIVPRRATDYVLTRRGRHVAR